MKKLQKIVAVIALVAAIITLFAACGKKESTGEKTITVTVVYQDGSSKDFTYTTQEKYLGPVLRNEGLVTGHYDGNSFFIDAVDGLAADYSANESWWKLLEGEEQTMVGVDELEIKDGGVYKLIYSIGF